MSGDSCEEIRLAAMALADGYAVDVPEQSVREHLEACADCRAELEPMFAVMKLLDAESRQFDSRQVWPLIEQKIAEGGASTPARDWRLLLVLAPGLVGYKLLELAPAQELPRLAKLAPLMFAALALALLVRENPFKINTELKLEGDTQ
jgi:hypothetical protein